MKYKQTVLIKKVSLDKANKTFNDIKFLKYLIALQPVKIIRWDGTFDGAKAHMKFWFFGWKDFVVKHGENKKGDSFFSFKDFGIILPFGLTKWEHTHEIIKVGEDIKIVDNLDFNGANRFLMFFASPILVFPILLRKILYKTYRWN